MSSGSFYTFGVDWDGPPPDEDGDGAVVVPQTRCPLSPSQLAELQLLYNPTDAADDYATSMYFDVLQFVQNEIYT